MSKVIAIYNPMVVLKTALDNFHKPTMVLNILVLWSDGLSE